MQYLLPAMLKILHEYDEKALFKEEFFEHARSDVVGRTFVQVAPVARFKNEAVDLKYDIGVRGNGVDAPVWPKDLKVQVVK